MDWLQRLQAEVAEHGIGPVAELVGISRAAVSLVVRGKYPSDLTGIERRVRDTYGSVECPFLAEEIPGLRCRAYRRRPMPMSSANALKHWRACQSCPLNPDREVQP